MLWPDNVKVVEKSALYCTFVTDPLDGVEYVAPLARLVNVEGRTRPRGDGPQQVARFVGELAGAALAARAVDLQVEARTRLSGRVDHRCGDGSASAAVAATEPNSAAAATATPSLLRRRAHVVSFDPWRPLPGRSRGPKRGSQGPVVHYSVDGRVSRVRGSGRATEGGPRLGSLIRHITIDCRDHFALMQFWREVLEDYDDHPDDPNRPGDEQSGLVGPAGHPWLLFVPVPEEKTVKNRLHLDIAPVDRTRDEEVDAAPRTRRAAGRRPPAAGRNRMGGPRRPRGQRALRRAQ